MKVNNIKNGDLVKIKSNLPINDEAFKVKFPGWNDNMDKLLGKWVVVLSIDHNINMITIRDGRSFFYLNFDSIDWDAEDFFAKKTFVTPSVGDWAIYYESEDDQEIATIGKVTHIIENEGKKEYSIDGFDGYTNVYLFDGDIKFLEAVRNNKV